MSVNNVVINITKDIISTPFGKVIEPTKEDLTKPTDEPVKELEDKKNIDPVVLGNDGPAEGEFK